MSTLYAALSNLAEARFERQRALIDDEQDRAESHNELIAQIAKERLKAKLSSLSFDDLIGGMHSVTQGKHGRALQAAFRESPEALGDLVMTIIVHAMSEDAELEAIAIAGDC